MAQFVDPMHAVAAKIALVERGLPKTLTLYLPCVPRIGELVSIATSDVDGIWKIGSVQYSLTEATDDGYLCQEILLTATQVD